MAMMWRELGNMRQRDLQRLELLASVFELQATQLFDRGAQALDVQAQALARNTFTVAQFQALQHNQLQSMPFVHGMALLDLQGKVIASTRDADRGTRIDLQRLSSQPLSQERVTIGRFMPASLTAKGAPALGDAQVPDVIPLLRPVRLTDGTLLLMALIAPQALVDNNGKLLDIVGTDARMQLILDDGGLPIHIGQKQAAGDGDLKNHPERARFLAAHQGTYGPTSIADKRVLGSWHRSNAYAFTSVAEQQYSVTSERWLNTLRGPLLFMAPAVLLIALMTGIALRSARAREAAQRERDAAQNEIVRREREFSVLLKNVQELIFRTDTEGQLRFVSHHWQVLTGHNPDTALGKHLGNLVLPNCRKRIGTLFDPQGPQGMRTAQVHMQGTGGSIHMLDISVMPLTDSDGRVRGYAGSAVDITELHQTQQKLQENLAFTESLVESNPLPMCMTDMQGRFVVVNQAWEKFMGIARSQALGRTNRDLLPAPEAQAYDAHNDQLSNESDTLRYEERLQRPDGSVRDVQITKVLVRNTEGKPQGILINKNDITDYLAARDQAHEASRTKSEFVANISHELRTPLQSILGFSELGMLRARQHERFVSMFSDIHGAGQRMLELVNDLLDISKIESTVGAFHFERNDVRDVVQDVTDELQMLLDRKGLVIEMELGRAPLVSKVDTTRFSQLVRNVLSNAIKFSPQGSAISISASAPDEETIQIQIRDHGPGIPSQELETIFDAFVQSSKTRDGSGGTGLGLAICRKIVTAHGGQIHATNAKDGGSIFHITLPSANYTDTMPGALL
jgi:PAS domain S-box-containing protein